jgi:hypothetical protein
MGKGISDKQKKEENTIQINWFDPHFKKIVKHEGR